MIFDQTVTIRARPDQVWEFLMDIPAMSRCVPGVESIAALDENTFLGALKVRVGPISVRLQGKLTVVERNLEEWRSEFDIDAADPRLNGAVRAKSTMRLTQLGDMETQMSVHTDAAVLGRLGEFGQGIMRRKADQVMTEFVQNMAQVINASGPRP